MEADQTDNANANVTPTSPSEVGPDDEIIHPQTVE